eukprot:tig00001065_g6748.t1
MMRRFDDHSRLWHLQVQFGAARSAEPAIVERILEMSQEPHPAEEEDAAFDELVELVRETFSAGTVEEILQRLAKLNSAWGDATAQALRRMSPTAVKVTMRALLEARGQQLSMEECVEREFRLAQRFMKRDDFYEGVRAQLVDKDRKPAWKPAALEALSASDLQWYFQPQPADAALPLDPDRVGAELAAEWPAHEEGEEEEEEEAGLAAAEAEEGELEEEEEGEEGEEDDEEEYEEEEEEDALAEIERLEHDPILDVHRGDEFEEVDLDDDGNEVKEDPDAGPGPAPAAPATPAPAAAARP